MPQRDAFQKEYLKLFSPIQLVVKTGYRNYEQKWILSGQNKAIPLTVKCSISGLYGLSRGHQC